MLKIGITGMFGSGKTTVAAMFRRQGAAVIDADVIVHDVFDASRACREKIRKAFGKDVIKDGKVDRSALGRIVFADTKALKRLERIIHPLAWKKTRSMLQSLSSAKCEIVVIDAPLLIEAGWHAQVDKVIVVKTLKKELISRVETRMGLTRKEILSRLSHQMPIKDKLKYADFVITNNGLKSETYKQVKNIWKTLHN